MEDLPTQDVRTPPDMPTASMGSPSPWPGAVPSITPELRPGSEIGRYTLLERLGEGGFGVVYLAERRHPILQRVALKVLKPGMDSAAVLARFEQERQTLALLDHPNIARVLDAGATPRGLPYFVMEHVKGRPITAFCDERRMPLEARLTLFIDVCDAVQHAHMRGVLHRDLKPSNILVAEAGERAVAKVIDFGVAKAMGGSGAGGALVTEAGLLVGTPEYMSPEQAEGRADIDVRSDVYALGVVLYEILTGLLPFEPGELRSQGLVGVGRVLREVEPPTPTRRLSGVEAEALRHIARHRGLAAADLRGRLRRELEWIPLHAMRKAREERYPAARDLAEDLRRYLSGRPLMAGPESLAYRARKFVRRNRLAVAAGGAVALTVAAGVVSTGVFAVREAQQRRLAERRRGEVERVVDFQRSMLAGVDATRAGEELLARISRDALKGVGDVQAEGVRRALASVNATDVAVDFMDRTILAPAVAAVGPRFAAEPAVEASLKTTLAQVYVQLGLFDRAEPLAVRALELLRQTHGGDAKATAEAMTNLGHIRWLQGKPEEGAALLEGALATMERLLGPDHEDVAAFVNNVAGLRDAQGRPDQAADMYKRALAIAERTKGPDHPDALLYANNVGGMLEALGRNEDAAASYKRALDGAMRARGPDHPETLSYMNNYAGPLTALGKEAEAEDLYRRVVDSRRRVLGAEHPETLNAVNNLAWIMSKRGRYAEAEALLNEALAASRATLGEDHPRTMILTNNLARAVAAQGRLDEAESVSRALIARQTRVSGAADANTLASRTVLVSTLRDLGRLEDALAEAEDAAAIAEPLPEGVPVREALRALAADLAERLDKARPGEGYDRRAARWKKPGG